MDPPRVPPEQLILGPSTLKTRTHRRHSTTNHGGDPVARKLLLALIAVVLIVIGYQITLRRPHYLLNRFAP